MRAVSIISRPNTKRKWIAMNTTHRKFELLTAYAVISTTLIIAHLVAFVSGLV